jgi:hypothetical protein
MSAKVSWAVARGSARYEPLNPIYARGHAEILEIVGHLGGGLAIGLWKQLADRDRHAFYESGDDDNHDGSERGVRVCAQPQRLQFGGSDRDYDATVRNRWRHS